MSTVRKLLLAVVACLVTCRVASYVSINPLADEWKGYTLYDFEEAFGCDTRTEYKVPDKEAWMIMRKAYHDVVGEKSNIAPLLEENGMKVPFYVAHYPGKGRAVFASEPVKKGTLVWNGRQEAHFLDGESYRNFLVSLPSADLVCDAVSWTWAGKKDGVFYIATIFDEGSMMNDPSSPPAPDPDDETAMASTGDCISENGMVCDGSIDMYNNNNMVGNDDDEPPNTGCISETTGEIISGGACDSNYAIRDIEAGEEITCEYGEYAHYADAMDHFGLQYPLADEWKDYTLYDFEVAFGCDTRTEYKIPDKEAWMIMRKVYHDVVGEKSNIAPLSEENGMKVPFYVAHSPGKGRAVFASEPVKKGTLVWNGRQEAHFLDRDSYMNFLVSLPSADLVCDAVVWTWAQKEDGVFYIATVFDEGAMMNDPSSPPAPDDETYDETYDETEMASTGDCSSESGMVCDDSVGLYNMEDNYDGEPPNTGCISETTGEILSGGACDSNYALRDIEAGEEITCEYGEFADYDAMDHFGLQ